MTSERLKAEIVAILQHGGPNLTTQDLRDILAARDWKVAPSVRNALKTSRVQHLCEDLHMDGQIKPAGDGWAIR